MSFYRTLCGESGTAYSANGNGSAPSAPSGSSDNGYVNIPQAWEAPESFVTEGTTFTHYASPYNPSDTGIVRQARNEVESAIEIEKQLPPSFSYPGPVAGAGFLGLFAPAPGSPEYNAYVASRKVTEDFNPEHVGLPLLESNKRSTVNEVAKQVQGPTLWDKFTGAVHEGYTQAPEDVNVFEESIKGAGKAVTGIINPSNYPLLLIGGGILLLLLVIRR